MATTNENRELIKTLQNRISELVDQVHILKSELGTFKSDVANDVKYLTDRVDGGR